MGMNNDENDEPGAIQIYQLGFCWLGFCRLGFIPTTNIYVDDDANGQ